MQNFNPGTQHHRTYDQHPVNNPLVVLRKIDFSGIDPETLKLLAGVQIQYRTPEASLAWFADGYILNDQVRIAGLTDEIMKNTLGFAVGRTDRQQVMADGLSLKEAEKAVNGAKMTLDLNIEVPVEQAVGYEDDAEYPAEG